jgi:solute carrier family 25 phosphate transporter 3
MATGLASWARPTAVASTSRRCEPLGSDCGLRVTHDRGLGFRKRAKHAFAARNRNKYGRGQGHGHKIQCVASLMTGALLAKYAAAGGVGACVSHAGAVPLDVVKTRVQQDPQKFARSGGVFDSMKLLVDEEGIGVLARGLGNTMLGFLLHGAFKYGGFEYLKQAFLESDNPDIATWCHDHRLLTLLLAAAATESIATLALLPLEQTRIKMVADKRYAPNAFAAVKRLFREEGLDGLANSLPPIYAKMIPFSMFQLATYDVAVGYSRDASAALAVFLAAASENAGGAGVFAFMETHLSETLTSPLVAQIPASFLAALLASLASQPGDTLMSVINKGSGGGKSESETVDTANSQTVDNANILEFAAIEGVVRGNDSVDGNEAEEGSGSALEVPVSKKYPSKKRPGIVETAMELGWSGLYAGWAERLAHVSAVIVIQLVCYDEIKHALIR